MKASEYNKEERFTTTCRAIKRCKWCVCSTQLWELGLRLTVMSREVYTVSETYRSVLVEVLAKLKLFSWGPSKVVIPPWLVSNCVF